MWGRHLWTHRIELEPSPRVVPDPHLWKVDFSEMFTTRLERWLIEQEERPPPKKSMGTRSSVVDQIIKEMEEKTNDLQGT